jgi:hypothetical protein
MLDKSDTDIVREWLLVALTVAESQGKTASELAAWCGVSPQAVSGWKKTGRISKGHLERAALFFGSGPSFTRGTPYAARESVLTGWPFPDIDRDRFDGLSFNQKIEIQGLVRDRIERFEGDAPSASPAPRAATKKPPAAKKARRRAG